MGTYLCVYMLPCSWSVPSYQHPFPPRVTIVVASSCLSQGKTKTSAECLPAYALGFGYIGHRNRKLLRYACTDFLASANERMC